MQQDTTNNKSSKKRKRAAVSFETLVNPNFEELARQFPAFQSEYRKLHKGKFLEVTPEFSLALARALLQIHWNLRLPYFDSLQHLCPPIPNRYFFVQWLQTTVLPSTRRFFDTGAVSSPPDYYCLSHRGLDIGTGAAAIYALLYAATSTWNIYATDIDPNSVRQAQANVQANHLESQVHVLLVEPTETQKQQQAMMMMNVETNVETMESTTTMSTTGAAAAADTNADITPLLPKGPLRCSLDALPPADDDASAHSRFDFCMTNPPFFDLTEDGGGEQALPPRADGRERIAMTNQEGSYPGGEFAFVSDMIADGLYLYLHQDQGGAQVPLWCSCMCGKKTTWTRLKGILQYLLGPSHVLSTEFGPGFMTRWFLAWTWERPKIDSKLANTKTFSFSVSLESSQFTSAAERLAEIVKRVREYCESFPAASLIVDVMSSVDSNGLQRQRARIRPRHTELSTDQDTSLPESIRRVLSSVSVERRLDWLPRVGHFCVDIVVGSNAVGHADLTITTFAHTKAGQAVVDKIQVQLESEIGRTNRKWRRILQRQQQQLLHQDAMDET